MRQFTRNARQVVLELNLPQSAVEWIESRARDGLIPCVEIGGHLFFDAPAVDAAIARLAAADVAGEVDVLLPVGAEVNLPLET